MLKIERKAGDDTKEVTFNIPFGTPMTPGSRAGLPARAARKDRGRHPGGRENERVAKAIALAE